MRGQLSPFNNGQANYLLGVRDIQLGDNPSDHNYFNIDHGRQNFNRFCYPNRKGVSEKNSKW